MDSLTSHAVRLEGIHKRFGSQLVLDEVTLDIDAGELLVLLGPSGCGKSTLLNIIAGLEEATAGRVVIGGRDVTRLEPAERDIAMVFQAFALYPTMSVRRNLGFALKMNGVPAREVDRRVAAVAQLLHIESLLDRRPAQISGGQQQRVAIGRAIVRNPAVFLLDEPLSNLDAKLRAEMREELRRLHEKSCRTTLHVTHDQMEAMTLATRVAILKDGRIQQCDRPAVVYQRPANLFVASFVGAPAMKFLAGTFHRCEGASSLSLSSGQVLPLPGLCPRRAPEEGQPVILGLRPESVHLVGTGTSGSFHSEVLRTEHTGPDVYLTLNCAGHELIARVAPRFAVRPGQQVAVLIDGTAARLFQPDDGHRLN